MRVIIILSFVIGASGTAWAQQILVQNSGEFAGARFESAIINDAGGVSFLIQQDNYRIYTLQPGGAPVLYAEQDAYSVQDEGLIAISRLMDYDDGGTVVFSGYVKLEGDADRYAALLRGQNADTSGGLGGDTIYDCLDGRCDAGSFTFFTEADYRAGDVAYVLRLPAGNQIVSVRGSGCSFVSCFSDNVGLQDTSAALLGGSNLIWLQHDDEIFRRHYVGTVEEEMLGDLGTGRAPRGFQFNGQGRSTYYEDDIVYRATATGSTETIIDVSSLPMPGNKQVLSVAMAPSGDIAFAVNSDELGTPERISIHLTANPGVPIITEGYQGGGATIDWISELQRGSVASDGRVVVAARWTVCPSDSGGSRGGDGCEQFEGVLMADGETEFTAPPISETVYWNNADGGSFGEPTNWDPEIVPDSGKTAAFELLNAYIVDVNDASVLRTVVNEGEVGISGSLTNTTTSLSEPSLTVGETPGTTQTPLLTTFNMLNTIHARVGDQGAGQVNVVGSEWNSGGRLSVGYDATGTVDVVAGGKLQAAELRFADRLLSSGVGTVRSGVGAASELSFQSLALGYRGSGSLTVSESASIIGNTTVIGLKAQASGTLTLDDVFTEWLQNGPMTIGDLGVGTVEINDGALMEVLGNVTVGASNSSQLSSLTLSGYDAPSKRASTLSAEFLSIGDFGHGSTIVENGAEMALSDVLVGQGLGEFVGEGFLIVRGSAPAAQIPSALNVTDQVILGVGGGASVFVHDGARVTSSYVRAGSFGPTSLASTPGDASIEMTSGAAWFADATELGFTSESDPELVSSEGSLSLSSDSLFKSTIIEVGTGGVITGSGTVEGQVSVTGEGMIAPELIQGPNAKGVDADLQLNIVGSLSMTGGIIGVTAFGATPNEHSAVNVSADADINGTTIRISFAPGYAPRAQDTWPLLVVDGNLSASDMSLQYAGIEPGFQYQVLVDGSGDLQFEALNDGVAWAADTLFRSSFGPEYSSVGF